jgi:hypothetical protein
MLLLMATPPTIVILRKWAVLDVAELPQPDNGCGLGNSERLAHRVRDKQSIN